MNEYKRTEKQEKELQEKNNNGKGAKFDTGKTRYDLVPPWAEDILAKVYTYGTQKYDDHNWANGMEWGKLYAALRRHLNQWFRGETLDNESGLPHLAHVAWQCFSLMEYQRNNIGIDDRPEIVKDLEITEDENKLVDNIVELIKQQDQNKEQPVEKNKLNVYDVEPVFHITNDGSEMNSSEGCKVGLDNEKRGDEYSDCQS